MKSGLSLGEMSGNTTGPIPGMVHMGQAHEHLFD